MLRRAPGAIEVRNKRTPPVRIHRKLVGFLRRWQRADAGLVSWVVHYNGQPIKRDLHTSWDRACARAGLEKVTPHTLRHTRATWLMQSGKVDLWEAAGALGMTVRVLEDVYAKQHPGWQKNASEV